MPITLRNTISCLQLMVLLSLFLILSSCKSTDPEEEIIDVQIIVPQTGYQYNSYDSVYVVAKCNIQTFEYPAWWKYSTDGRNWTDMSIFSVKREDSQLSDDDSFDYDIHRWVPENDSLDNIEIYIKVESYNDPLIFDMVGPVTIN